MMMMVSLLVIKTLRLIRDHHHDLAGLFESGPNGHGNHVNTCGSIDKQHQ